MFSRKIKDASKKSYLINNDINSLELLEAINQNDIDKVKSYIPSINVWQIKDENGNTPLHYSVYKNNYELTTLIIEEAKKGLGLSSHKISNFINEKNDEGYTALLYSVKNGNLEIYKYLKKLGAKVEITTNLGKNALHISAETNNTNMLIFLLLNEPLDIYTLDDNGSTPLHWACYSGAYEVANYLLCLKADINSRDKQQITPLFLAVDNNRENIVRLLLMYGADKNLPNNKKIYPIDIAKKKNFTKIIFLLKDKPYNQLCTLESPTTYIKPSDAYRKLILIIIIITELIIFIIVLPFFENIYYMFINLGSFLLCLLSYIILLYKSPGYVKNPSLSKEYGQDILKALKFLLDSGENLENYCPRCHIKNKKNIKHCFICDKCVLEMSHHCFWFNKCIGKNNKFFYIIFLFLTFTYAFISIFICTNLIFDTVTIPYIKTFLPYWLYFDIDRGIRVLGATIISWFCFFLSFPLFTLLMIELFKKCGLLPVKIVKIEKIKGDENNENNIDVINDKDIKDNEKKIKGNYIDNINKKIEEIIVGEDNSKEDIINNIENNKDNKEENNINENIDINNKEEEKSRSSVKIPKEDFPLVDNDRPSNI